MVFTLKCCPVISESNLETLIAAFSYELTRKYMGLLAKAKRVKFTLNLT